MAIDVFYSADENGLEGARKKAKMLRDEYGYRIISVKHCSIPRWSSTSAPYTDDYLKTELGYKITVDTGNSGYDPITE